MIPDVKLDDTSMFNLGWLRESIDFPTPKPQTDTIIVPGRNSPIRFTESLGRVSFQPRTFEIVLSALLSREQFNEKSSEIVNAYNGKLTKVILSEEPELYAIGTLQMTASYDPLQNKGQLTVNCEDADAYRYHVSETEYLISGNTKYSFKNDFMPVVPTITATEETTLHWAIGKESFSKTISAGTWTIPELELQSGRQTITIQTKGKVTIIFREGRL